MDMLEVMRRLCALGGPSGYEQDVSQAARELLWPLTDSVSIDPLGNVIGLHSCGRPDAKKILLDAHLDQVGFMVTGYDGSFLRFTSIGGIDPRMLPNREMILLTKPEPTLGVVSCLPPHIQSAADHNKSVPIEDLRIDAGLNADEIIEKIPVGTPIVYRADCFPMAAGGQICSKALDDRSCFTILLRTLEILQGKDLDVDVYVMGSVQEEVAGSGAAVGTFSVNPDCCIAVDVTFAWTPDVTLDDAPCKMYGGPCIGVGPNMTWWMTDRMVDTAKVMEIPYQLEVMEGHTGTNGWHMQLAREGVPTSIVSLPLKYMHSPIEVIAQEDMENCAQLLAAFIQTLGKEAM